jgi:hypothetical protein
MAEKIWVTSDLPESHTALWDPDAAHGRNGLHLRGGQVAEVAHTDHVKAQLKGDNAPLRRATEAEIKAARKEDRAEAKAPEAAP